MNEHHATTPRATDAAGPTAAEKLRLLRAELARLGVDGFVVPRADEHQGEYVPACAERLHWLTGFSGSAGMAIVLAEKAAIFVDGRYTLQVKDEVPAELYEYRHLTTEPATDWIAGNLPAGGRLGFDPWLMTPNRVARFREAVSKAAGELVALETNPVDAVWDDRPPPPAAPVVPHDLAFAGRSSAEKRDDVAATLKKAGHDAAVLSAPDSIAWLLNIRGGDLEFSPQPLSFALLRADATVDLFIDPRKPVPELARHLGPDVRCHPPDALGDALDALGRAGKTVRLSGDGDPEWIAMRLREAGATIALAGDPCLPPKARKTAAELDGMRAAHRRDGASLTRFLAWLAETAPAGGVTEMSAADRLEALRRGNSHFRGLSFPTISGAGPDGAIVHYRVTPETDRALETGMLYLVDSGAQYLDGTTDVTRTVAIGTPTDEMRERFTRVLKGHIALATARFPKGTTGSQLDPFARRALWEAGLDYDHGTGHGVGSYLNVHEGPQRISKVASTVALEPGMVVSNEPGYYKTGAYGIRIENLVAVAPVDAPDGAEQDLLGFETLTLAPIDRSLIEPALLDDGERAWLDGYHARVRETLTPLVDDATARWLAGATAPLA